MFPGPRRVAGAYGIAFGAIQLSGRVVKSYKQRSLASLEEQHSNLSAVFALGGCERIIETRQKASVKSAGSLDPMMFF